MTAYQNRPNNQVLIVLAGNERQYNEYLTLQHILPKKAVYGCNTEKVKSVEAHDVVVTGTFWNRDDAKSVYDLAKTRVRS